ncbi:hypothetical protein FRC11_001131 [Ceratobasidium sp. 423]|nr:hypothetical protein FRC11_001131 [Ceratobasidium sp. 423]
MQLFFHGSHPFSYECQVSVPKPATNTGLHEEFGHLKVFGICLFNIANGLTSIAIRVALHKYHLAATIDHFLDIHPILQGLTLGSSSKLSSGASDSDGSMLESELEEYSVAGGVVDGLARVSVIHTMPRKAISSKMGVAMWAPILAAVGAMCTGIEVKWRLDHSEVLKCSKAKHEYFELEPTKEEYDSDSEIDLPDLAKFVTAWNNGMTQHEPTKHVQTPKSHSASNMDDSKTERVWAKETHGKGSHKPKMFSSTSKVHSNGPAQPAISPRNSPKKSCDHSPSPRHRSSKDESTRGCSKHCLHAHDTSQDECGDHKAKKSTKKKAK